MDWWSSYHRANKGSIRELKDMWARCHDNIRGGLTPYFRRGLIEVNDTPLNGDGAGLCAVAGFEFGEDVADMLLHRGLRDG